VAVCLCAQVSNTNGVKQQLWGVKLTGRVAPGAPVTSEDGSETLGVVTSYANLEKEGHFALAYLKCRRSGVQVRGICLAGWWVQLVRPLMLCCLSPLKLRTTDPNNLDVSISWGGD
jgi:hypothetical protein